MDRTSRLEPYTHYELMRILKGRNSLRDIKGGFDFYFEELGSICDFLQNSEGILLIKLKPEYERCFTHGRSDCVTIHFLTDDQGWLNERLQYPHNGCLTIDQASTLWMDGAPGLRQRVKALL